LQALGNEKYSGRNNRRIAVEAYQRLGRIHQCFGAGRHRPRRACWGSHSSGREGSTGSSSQAQAKQITQLQHKLNQAFENVRPAESMRENLKGALAMNESPRAKVDEFHQSIWPFKMDEAVPPPALIRPNLGMRRQERRILRRRQEKRILLKWKRTDKPSSRPSDTRK
jgi:hypothetical protein